MDTRLRCMNGHERILDLPNIKSAQTVYLPIALSANGASITSPITVSGVDPNAEFIAALDAQLSAYGFEASATFNVSYRNWVGTYYSDSYAQSAFFILDEGNTFAAEDVPRGLVPFKCFVVS